MRRYGPTDEHSITAICFPFSFSLNLLETSWFRVLILYVAHKTSHLLMINDAAMSETYSKALRKLLMSTEITKHY